MTGHLPSPLLLEYHAAKLAANCKSSSAGSLHESQAQKDKTNFHAVSSHADRELAFAPIVEDPCQTSCALQVLICWLPACISIFTTPENVGRPH